MGRMATLVLPSVPRFSSSVPTTASCALPFLPGPCTPSSGSSLKALAPSPPTLRPSSTPSLTSCPRPVSVSLSSPRRRTASRAFLLRVSKCLIPPSTSLLFKLKLQLPLLQAPSSTVVLLLCREYTPPCTIQLFVLVLLC